MYSKIRVRTSLSNFVPKSELRKFRHEKAIVLSTNSSTVELVDHTYNGRPVVAEST